MQGCSGDRRGPHPTSRSRCSPAPSIRVEAASGGQQEPLWGTGGGHQGGSEAASRGTRSRCRWAPGRWRGGTGGRGPIAAVTVTQLTRDAETVPSRRWGRATRYPAECPAAQKDPQHRQRPGPRRHRAARPTCPLPPLRGFITAVGPGCLLVACSSAQSLKLEDHASSPTRHHGRGDPELRPLDAAPATLRTQVDE